LAPRLGVRALGVRHARKQISAKRPALGRSERLVQTRTVELIA
jgi:hypothetical protein